MTVARSAIARLALGVALGLALLTLLSPASYAGRGASGAHWEAKPGVEVSPAVRAKLDAIATIFHAKTKRTLLVTSGTRSPREQAAAMYGKLRAGSRCYGYRNQAAIEPIRRAYDQGRRKRWSRDRIVDAMGDIIADQVARGVYISRHLRAGAFDVRIYTMTARQRRAFRAAVAEVGGVSLLEEKKPPHFHLELRNVSLKPDEDDGSGEDGEP